MAEDCKHFIYPSYPAMQLSQMKEGEREIDVPSKGPKKKEKVVKSNLCGSKDVYIAFKFYPFLCKVYYKE